MVHRVLPKHSKVQLVSINTSDPKQQKPGYRFRINAIPATFLFDSQGKLLTHFLGPRVEEQIEETLQRHGL
jgi:thioredoxin-like negative regulator of GroEL